NPSAAVARVALPHEERRCRLEDFDRLLKLSITVLQCPDLRGRRRRDPVTLAVVDLVLANPVAQRLGGHPQPFGHRGDRRPLARIIITLLQHQPDSLGPRLRVILARHDMHLPKNGGAHQTRDGSVLHRLWPWLVAILAPTATPSEAGSIADAVLRVKGKVSRRVAHTAR